MTGQAVVATKVVVGEAVASAPASSLALTVASAGAERTQ